MHIARSVLCCSGLFLAVLAGCSHSKNVVTIAGPPQPNPLAAPGGEMDGKALAQDELALAKSDSLAGKQIEIEVEERVEEDVTDKYLNEGVPLPQEEVFEE